MKLGTLVKHKTTQYHKTLGFGVVLQIKTYENCEALFDRYLVRWLKNPEPIWMVSTVVEVHGV